VPPEDGGRVHSPNITFSTEHRMKVDVQNYNNVIEIYTKKLMIKFEEWCLLGCYAVWLL
jgi:hypothetical protein